MWNLITNIATGIVVAQVVLAGGLCLSGLLPALWRLGNGLSRRKIAVFAKGDAATMLRNQLLDSKLFRKANVNIVTSPSEIGRAETASLFLVHWPDWGNALTEILNRAKDTTALVVYAPDGPRSIPEADFRALNQHRNAVVSNFRGRLLNDIVSSMITTSYEKR